MMKMVPARRLVTEASWVPPSSDFSRAKMPASDAVAGWVSITATRQESSEKAARRGGYPIYQRIVKIRAPPGITGSRVPTLPPQICGAQGACFKHPRIPYHADPGQ